MKLYNKTSVYHYTHCKVSQSPRSLTKFSFVDKLFLVSQHQDSILQRKKNVAFLSSNNLTTKTNYKVFCSILVSFESLSNQTLWRWLEFVTRRVCAIRAQGFTKTQNSKTSPFSHKSEKNALSNVIDCFNFFFIFMCCTKKLERLSRKGNFCKHVNVK